MRHVICALSLLLCLAPAIQAKTSLTLIIQFENRHSQESFDAMKSELQVLMKDVAIDWRLLEEMQAGESFPDLVVVKFKGACLMERLPSYLIDERGPLAFTHTAEGQVLPFSEVECDKVRQAIHSAMWGDEYKHADALLGRALGRVLAHELYHVLEHTKKHEKEGVNRSGLTGRQLISDRRP